MSTDCYGRRGPWAGRPGFEPLAQAVTGWAAEHARDGHPDIVSALPCDYVTGYLSALGVMEALARRSSQGGSWRVHTSLCRTAMWLRDQPGRHRPAAEEDIRLHTTRDLRTTVQSGFGRIESLRPAVEMSLTPPRLERPPAPPGTDAPAFAPSC